MGLNRVQRHWLKKLVRISALLLLLLVSFTGGAYLYKTGHVSKLVNQFRNVSLQGISNRLTGPRPDVKRIDILIDLDDYAKLEEKRAIALARGTLIAESDSYVPIRISAGADTMKAKVRLKGGSLIHLEGDKWSLRIKIKKKALMGMKFFSLQAPDRSGYLREWIMYEMFKYEGLIALKYDYIDVYINNEYMGVYALEESYRKELLARNNRREAPILKFDEANQIRRGFGLSAGDFQSENDLFQEANITCFSKNKVYKDDIQRKYFLYASQLLSDFRMKKKTVSQVFDIDKVATVFATMDLFNSYHGIRWKNLRFYYNPITQKLELIAYDANGNGKVMGTIKETLYQAWNREEYVNIQFQTAHELIDLFFRDREFVELYMQNLNRISKPGYLESFFESIDINLQEKLRIIHNDYFFYFFSKGEYLTNRDKIQELIHPNIAIKAYLKLKPNSTNSLTLSIANTSYMPIEIIALKCISSGQRLQQFDPNIVQGKHQDKALNYSEIAILTSIGPTYFCSDKVVRKGNEFVFKDIILEYKIVGLDSILFANVKPQSDLSLSINNESGARMANLLDSLLKSNFLKLHKQTMEITIQRGNWTIKEDLIIPERYTLICGSSTTIDLINQAAIICYGPIKFEGTEHNPIQITSTDFTGQGLIVLNSENQSKLSYVHFTELMSYDKNNWSLSGAVTFYESDVSITNCHFHNAKAEDALNIVRSNFRIDSCSFENSFSDAFDSDFSKGTFHNTSFTNIGNDALDFSGSQVTLNDIIIDHAQDKGITAGEKSLIEVTSISIQHSEIGLVSKDLSYITVDGANISNSKVAFAVFQKKAQYGKGSIQANNIKIVNVQIPYLVEFNSSLTIDGIYIQPTHKNIKGILYGKLYGK